MDRKERAEEYRRREQIISITMRIIQAACASAILFIAFTLLQIELFTWAAILVVAAGLYGWTSQTYGSSQRLIRWYETIIEQEEAMYARHGDKFK